MHNNINVYINNKDTGKRIDLVLSEKLPNLSRSRIQNLILKGNVIYNSKIIRDQSLKLKIEGEINIKIPLNKKMEIKSQNIDLNIVFEDMDLVVINKSAGMVVHPAFGNYENTLVNALLYHCGKSLSGIGGVERPGIVHRLDKMTSGLIVIAKNDESHRNLSRQFKDKTILREYRAIAWNKLKKIKGIINTNICRSKKNRKLMSISYNKEEGKNSLTSYELGKEYQLSKKYYLNYIKCRLQTGRTHQIRVHMSSIGNFLLGDNTYGKRKNISHDLGQKLLSTIQNDWIKKNRHALHAKTLGFIHPTKGKNLFFSSEDPLDFKKIIKILDNLKQDTI